jgi:hypothetical protein
VKPADAPKVDRSIDPATGAQSVNGEQALTGLATLYDYIGSVVGQLDALIDAEVARQAEEAKKPKH